MPTLRRALATIFFLTGVALSSWVARTPQVRTLVDASTADMGLILLGLSLGSMIGVLASGPLVARVGVRRVAALGGTGIAAGVGVVGAGAQAGSQALVAGGLALFGLGMGVCEVAINVGGGVVERELRRATLPLLHGCYSLGAVVGAVIGMLATAARVPVGWHLGAVAAVVLVVGQAASRTIPGQLGRREVGRQARRWSVDAPLLLIGVIILALSMAEGTANDWLPLLLVDGHGLPPALASGTFAVFSATMALGRFAGGAVVDRVGGVVALRASAAVGAVGLALVSFVDSAAVALVGVVLWGCGAALGFPVAISQAAASGGPGAGEDGAPGRVAFAATVGYAAFLVGPPVLGFLGEHYGLRGAIVVVLALVALAVAATVPLSRARA